MIATPIVMIVTPIAKSTRYIHADHCPSDLLWCGLGPSVQLVLMLTGGTADAFIIIRFSLFLSMILLFYSSTWICVRSLLLRVLVINSGYHQHYFNNTSYTLVHLSFFTKGKLCTVTQPQHHGKIPSWVASARQQCLTFPLVIGERERANLVVRTAWFFYIIIYISTTYVV